MEKHSANALILAEFLASHPKVKGVNYTGLPSHPQHALASRQMSSGGGLLSSTIAESFRRFSRRS
jgi:cystathionine beta-lyase/cystathionine gamma-synthase